MVIANIKDRARYYSLTPALREALDFLATLSTDSREGIEGDGYRVLFSGKYVETSDFDAEGNKKKFEAHRQYLDVHYCIAGSEGIGYAETESLTPVTEYNEKDDYLLLEGEYRRVVLLPGDFCIVYPEDAHIPMMVGNGDGKLMKAVAKVAVASN